MLLRLRRLDEAPAPPLPPAAAAADDEAAADKTPPLPRSSAASPLDEPLLPPTVPPPLDDIPTDGLDEVKLVALPEVEVAVLVEGARARARSAAVISRFWKRANRLLLPALGEPEPEPEPAPAPTLVPAPVEEVRLPSVEDDGPEVKAEVLEPAAVEGGRWVEAGRGVSCRGLELLAPPAVLPVPEADPVAGWPSFLSPLIRSLTRAKIDLRFSRSPMVSAKRRRERYLGRASV